MEEKNTPKMDYESLKNVAAQLSEQNKQLNARVIELSNFNLFKRLEFLFKVVENIGSFSITFSDKCIKEIEDIMTIPETKEESTEETIDN